jgi:hypothetical protein
LFQAATDEHWGADCSKLMKAVSIYDFDRHFQLARTVSLRYDTFLGADRNGWIAEKTGNIQCCIEANNHIIFEEWSRTCALLPRLTTRCQCP